MSHFHHRALRRIGFGLAIAAALAGAGRAGAQLRAANGPGATEASLQRATFKVSFYGIQRYASSTTSRENPASGCFDVQQRGTESGLTVARFESTRPTRLTIVRAQAGLPDFSYRVTARDQIYPLVARASWNTSGSSGYEVSSCVAGSRMWHAAPQPAHACGSAQIPNTGGSLEPESGTKLLFAGGQNLPSLVDPLAGCAFGKHRSGSIRHAAATR